MSKKQFNQIFYSIHRTTKEFRDSVGIQNRRSALQLARYQAVARAMRANAA